MIYLGQVHSVQNRLIDGLANPLGNHSQLRHRLMVVLEARYLADCGILTVHNLLSLLHTLVILLYDAMDNGVRSRQSVGEHELVRIKGLGLPDVGEEPCIAVLLVIPGIDHCTDVGQLDVELSHSCLLDERL